jgi:hypothetical protein
LAFFADAGGCEPDAGGCKGGSEPGRKGDSVFEAFAPAA